MDKTCIKWCESDFVMFAFGKTMAIKEIQGVSKVRSDLKLYFEQSIWYFFRQVYTDSGEKFT